MPSWRRALIDRFMVPDAPRVLTMENLMAIVEEVRPGTPKAAVCRLVKDLDGLLFSKVSGDVLLNLKAFPEPTVGDAVPFLVKGAVVSLQTVLGDAGVLNNFTPNYYCVRPVSVAGDEVKAVLDLGSLEVQCLTLPDEVLNAGEREDRIEYGFDYPRATPEAALVHWLWLSRSPSVKFPEPSPEADVSSLDFERLDNLATASGLLGVARDWVRRANEYAENDDGFGYGPGNA